MCRQLARLGGLTTLTHAGGLVRCGIAARATLALQEVSALVTDRANQLLQRCPLIQAGRVQELLEVSLQRAAPPSATEALQQHREVLQLHRVPGLSASAAASLLRKVWLVTVT